MEYNEIKKKDRLWSPIYGFCKVIYPPLHSMLVLVNLEADEIEITNPSGEKIKFIRDKKTRRNLVFINCHELFKDDKSDIEESLKIKAEIYNPTFMYWNKK